MERETYELIVNREEQGIRLDAFLAQRLPEYSRSFLQKNIKDHYVTVDEKVSKASYKVSEGEKVSFEVPALKEPEIKPENILTQNRFQQRESGCQNGKPDSLHDPRRACREKRRVTRSRS